MARTNTGSTSNYITAVPPSLPLPLTMACWFRPANLTSNQNLLSVLNGTTTEYSVLAFDGANANGQGDNVVLAISGAGSEAFGVSGVYSGPTGQWMHCVAVFASTTSRAAYLQGSRGAIETTSKTATAPDFLTFGAYNNNAGGIFSPLNGAIAEAGIWDVALTDDEIYKLSRPGVKPTDVRPDHLRIYRSLDANESLPRGGIGLIGLAITGTMGVAAQPFIARNQKRLFRFKKPSGGAYTLTAAQGSYTLTGQAAGVRASRKITAAQGSYALTGQAAAIKVGYKVAAGQGSYALTGQAATLRATRTMAAGQGSYTLTGQAAALNFGHKLTAAQGSYTLTGQAAGVVHGFKITAAQGAYAVTGQAAALRAARLLTAAQGSYSLSGQAATLTYFAPGSYALTAAQGAYALTGQAAGLRATRKLTAAQGSYALTGRAAGLMRGRLLTAAQGAYTLTGQAAAARVARRLLADYGPYSLIGQAITLTYSGAVAPEPDRDPFDWLKSLRIPAAISNTQMRNMAYHHLLMKRLREQRRHR